MVPTAAEPQSIQERPMDSSLHCSKAVDTPPSTMDSSSKIPLSNDASYEASGKSIFSEQVKKFFSNNNNKKVISDQNATQQSPIISAPMEVATEGNGTYQEHHIELIDGTVETQGASWGCENNQINEYVEYQSPSDAPEYTTQEYNEPQLSELDSGVHQLEPQLEAAEDHVQQPYGYNDQPPVDDLHLQVQLPVQQTQQEYYTDPQDPISEPIPVVPPPVSDNAQGHHDELQAVPTEPTPVEPSSHHPFVFNLQDIPTQTNQNRYYADNDNFSPYVDEEEDSAPDPKEEELRP
ncbi:hypothetical protein WICPIJ_002359, partial [Wickerhamomyces pijperi]